MRVCLQLTQQNDTECCKRADKKEKTAGIRTKMTVHKKSSFKKKKKNQCRLHPCQKQEQGQGIQLSGISIYLANTRS